MIGEAVIFRKIVHKLDTMRGKFFMTIDGNSPEHISSRRFLDDGQVVDQANSIILRMDSHGKITFINPYAELFFGYSWDEIVGKNVVGTIVPERESTGRDLEAMIHDLGLHPEMYRNNINENIKHDGTRIWIAWTNRVVTDNTGQILELICIGNDVTEFTRIRDELRKSERTYRVLFEASKDPIAIIDNNGYILDVNQAGVDLFGYEKEQMLRMKASDFCSDPAEYAKLRDHLGQYGFIRNMEARHRKHSGEILDCLVSTAIWEDAEGGRRIYQTYIYDVTEQKRTQCALRESERKLSIVIDSIPEIVYRLTPEGKISFISDSVRMYGYKPEELLGKNIFDFVHPDDLQKARHALMERRTGTRRTHALEIRLLGKYSDSIPFIINSRGVEMDPIFLLEAEGLYRNDHITKENFLGTQGVAHDITEQKRAEREIQESREQFRALFESNPEAVILIDQETGRILDVNNSGTKIYGYTREEFAQLSRDDICAAKEIPLEESCKDSSIHLFHKHRKKDGSVFPAEITGSEIELMGHRMYLCAIRDVTDRLRAEEESLLRVKLQGALEMAHAVCHEINQPLQVIAGYAELLTHEKFEMELFPRYVTEIQSAVQRMAEITWKLNNITRYETITYVADSKIIDITRASQI